MRRFLATVSLSLLAGAGLQSPGVAAQQLGRMSVTVVASGADSTRSEGEWSRGTFSYRAAFTSVLETDGELSDVNPYDPAYAENALAAAAAAMARIQAAQNGQFSDEEEESEPDYRYLFYTGQTDCPTTLSIAVDERLEGEYADVGGMQPYTMTFTAQSEGSEPERMLLCVGSSSVLDTRDDVLYRSTLGFPEVTGHYLFSEANRGVLQDDPQARQQALPQVVSEYLFNTLRVAPASGRVKSTLRPSEPVVSRIGTFGGYEGSVEVEIIWAFEALE